MLSYLAQNKFLIKNESIDDKSIIDNFTKDIIKFSKELELNLDKNLNDETEEELYGNTVFNNNCNDNNNIILNLQQLELKKVLRNIHIKEMVIYYLKLMTMKYLNFQDSKIMKYLDILLTDINIKFIHF